MKALLMHEDRDFDSGQKPAPIARELQDDLELPVLIEAMAGKDEFLQGIARAALLQAVQSDLGTIVYRQAMLQDVLQNPEIVRRLYQLSIDALNIKTDGYWGIGLHYPLAILHGGMGTVEALLQPLKDLRKLAVSALPLFHSPGWRRFLSMIQEELDDAYIDQIQSHLRTLKFRHGILVSAHLGAGNRGRDYVLRSPWPDNRGWLTRLLAKKSERYQYTLPPRDENGARALSELADRGLNLVANAVAQSAEHIKSFYTQLKTELAFYVGCLALRDRLSLLHEPVCFPVPAKCDERRHRFESLYDVCLALKMNQSVIPNTLDLGESRLTVITGANQGGKSSFLRSIGLAQIMMQCGMFVGATSFSANLADGIYTHYKREEDTQMESGKFDEELKRMQSLVDALSPNALMLFNESFAATNEREGSEVATMIVDALLASEIKVFFVTHQYMFAHGYYERREDSAGYLLAQRLPDGARSFKVMPGEPQQTSYGADLYAEVFESAAGPPG